MSTDIIDRTVEIERLAALEPIDYEPTRTEAANRLGFRTSVLDSEVKKKRRELGLDNGDADTGQGRAVKIDDVLPWPDPIEGDRIATILAVTIKKYAVMPDTAADTVAVWILHTWLIDKFTFAPRLAVTSPTKGCGKTTVLRLLAKLTRRPLMSGSVSPAALFRAVEQLQPTMILDENEKYLEPGGDLHALLNEGHCKGGKVMRTLGEGHELRWFNTFSAVAFARNGRIPDDLEQRSIVIEMQRRLAGESLAELRDDRCAPLQNLARMCARWADDVGDIICDHDPDMGSLINRTADNWRPLFAIADTIGSDWPTRIREAACALAPRESDSTDTMLLADIRAVFDEKKTDREWSEQICEALSAMEGRPWAEFGKTGKPITKNQLARRLDRFHVKPDSVRIGGKTNKGYYRDQFEAAWDRYLAPHASQGVYETEQRNNPDEMGTSCAFQSGTDKVGVPFQKCEKPAPNGHCSGVPFELQVAPSARDLVTDHGHKCAQCGEGGDVLETYAGSATPAWLHRECADAWLASYDDLSIPAYLDRRSELRVCAGTTPDGAATNGGHL